MRISGGRHSFDQLYEESREKTRKAIRTVYLRNPWQIPTVVCFTERIAETQTEGKNPQKKKENRVALGSATEKLVKRCDMTMEEAKESHAEIEVEEMKVLCIYLFIYYQIQLLDAMTTGKPDPG